MPPLAESANSIARRTLMSLVIAAGATGCGSGATDAPPPPLTAATRVDIQLESDSLLVGDSVTATTRAVNREGTVVPLTVVSWSSSDSSIGSVSAGGVLRARNIGSVRLDVIGDGVVGTKTIRMVPRALRVRLVVPDTVCVIDDIEITSEVEAASGTRLMEVAPRFSLSNPTLATLSTVAVGRARLAPAVAGSTDLLAVIGRDTTRKRIVIRAAALRSLSVSVVPRTLSIGDSVPYLVVATDSAGATVSTRGTEVGVEPAGFMQVRNGHLIALAAGRVELRAVNGSLSARDTVTGLAASEFPLDLIDGDAQNPLPERITSSMARARARWRKVIRSGTFGELVQLAVGECRNRTPVSQFVTGVRVLVRLDTLPASVAAQGGPCLIRANGLTLVGTIQVNIQNYNSFSDAKLDDILTHELGHVLGIGSLWGRGDRSGFVVGDATSPDPLFIGPSALSAFARLGGSTRFTGRLVPIEVRFLGHWRASSFAGELMAPSLSTTVQPMSAVTVAAMRDIGWNVEMEAYEEFALPASVLAREISPRVLAAPASLDGDVLQAELMQLPGGRVVKLGSAGADAIIRR